MYSVMLSFLFFHCFKQLFPEYFCIRSFSFLKNYLFWVVLGLCCCARAFSSCGEWELLLVVMQGVFIEVVSFVVEHRVECEDLFAPQHVESSWTRRDQTLVPYSGRQNLIHCATREVLYYFL